ncbi:MAG: transcriptional regulator [Cyclobacteriaceae bacterium]|nr:transcriptional regulator [Cyclobacteriaceae bacterium]
MDVKPIKSEEQYNQALKRIDELIDCEVNYREEEELEVISLLAWDYEEKHYKIDLLSPVQAIKMRMEGLGLKPKDLVNILGDKSRVSDILSMKRKLTLGMIRNLNKALNIPIETLVQKY